jgi:hypothetical protein
MNEIRDWLTQHGYSVLNELIELDGTWVLQVNADGVSIPLTLLARDVEHPQRGIAAIEALFAALRDV